MLKKIYSIFILSAICVFALSNNAFAENLAPVKIYEIIQEGCTNNDMDVDLINVDDENKVYTFTITEQDNYAIKVEIPEGKYKVKARIKNSNEYANVRAEAQIDPEIVKANAEGLDIATFTVMQGDYNFINDYAYFTDLSEPGKEHLKGILSKEKIKGILEDSIAEQDKDFMTGGEMEHMGEITPNDIKEADEKEKKESGYDTDISSEYDDNKTKETTKEENNKIQAEKIEATKESAKKVLTPYIIGGVLLVIALAFIVYKKFNK